MTRSNISSGIEIAVFIPEYDRVLPDGASDARQPFSVFVAQDSRHGTTVDRHPDPGGRRYGAPKESKSRRNATGTLVVKVPAIAADSW